MRLADQAAVITLGRLVERGAGMLCAIVLVRLLSKEDYGTFLQVGLAGSIGASLVLLGLPQSLLVFLPGVAPERRRSIISQTALLAAAPTALAGLILALGSGWLARGLHNPALSQLGLILGAYVFLFSLDRFVEPVLVALRQAKQAGSLAVISAVALAVAACVPAWLGWPMSGIYLCILVVYLFRLAYLTRVVEHHCRVGPWRPDGATVRRQISFAVPLGLAGITGQYNRQLDSVVVSFMFVPAVYAVYARGAFELPLVDLLHYTLAMVILPRLVELWKSGDRDSFTALWHRAVRISSWFVFPAFTFAAMFAEEIIILLFTRDYAGAVPVFRIYLLALPVRLTSYGVILQAQGDTRTVLHASLLGLALNAVLSFSLCPALGPPGAALGYACSQGVQAAWLLRTIRARSALGWRGILPWRRLAGAAAIAILAAPPARLAVLGLHGEIARLVVGALVFGSLTLAGYWIAGIVGAEERQLAARWIRLSLGMERKERGDQGGPPAITL